MSKAELLAWPGTNSAFDLFDRENGGFATHMKIQARLGFVAVGLLMAAGVVCSAFQPVLAAEPGKGISLSADVAHADAYDALRPIAIGKKAPDFTARTAEGKAIRLSEFKGKKNLVLVFYQGSFCSVCAAQLSNIQNHLSAFRAQDAEVIAISADDREHALQSVGEHGLTFNVVPDADKQIISRFGVANIAKKGIAWPSLFVVDKKGVVKLSYASEDGHRLHSNEILPVLSRLTGKPAPRLEYDQ